VINRSSAAVGRVLGGLAVVVMAALLTGAPAGSAAQSSATTVRVKDLASVSGTTGHKLIGYGLVVGLSGTGDSNRALFTARSLANMLEQFGVTVPAETLRADNVAAVIVTAELPSEARPGARLDVTASSLGDAESLQGGMLLVTPLMGADREVYAIAQGPVSIGGFNVSAGGSKVQKNHPVVGRVPNGASVVRYVTARVIEDERIHIVLHNPDFTTAERMSEAINAGFGLAIAEPIDRAAVQVRVPEAWAGDLVGFVARLEHVAVQPDAPARVVINERTGTVVLGGNVRVLPVAIAHGGLTVQVKTTWQVSQPPPVSCRRAAVKVRSEDATVLEGERAPMIAPGVGPKLARGQLRANSGRQGARKAAEEGPKGAFRGREGGREGVQEGRIAPESMHKTSDRKRNLAGWQPFGASSLTGDWAAGAAADWAAGAAADRAALAAAGRTVVVPEIGIEATEAPGELHTVPEQASLQDLVQAMNALGVKPRDLIAIIQALKEMGALEAELVIQ